MAMTAPEWNETHPILEIPGPDVAERLGYEAWRDLMVRRAELIRREREDPLRFGWEPPVWRLTDAILGWGEAEDGQAIRERLRMPEPRDQVLIQGGNRSGKSTYAAKRCVQALLRPESIVWCYHTNNQNSIDLHHRLIWEHLPPEWRTTVKSKLAYISYTRKYGFSDNKAVFPNGSEVSFRNYSQDIMTAEGGEADVVWVDECHLQDWVETLMLRIATRSGKLIGTFTPVRGYTGTVKLFLDGSVVVLRSPAHLLPEDAGRPDNDAALQVRDPLVEDDKTDRRWEMVPRVCRGFSPAKAVVYFHSSDNPYGNPRNVLQQIAGTSAAYVRERFYGVANKTVSGKFPRFGEAHLVKAVDIPTKGFNVQVVDPATMRNWFMGWFRVVGEVGYVAKEWPGKYEVPGMGFPGPWAEPDGRKLDGRQGPAQDTFGFGLAQYKIEIARVEGWEDWKKWQKDGGEAKVEDWDPANGAEITVDLRYMDSRYLSTPKLENDRVVTLLDEFADIGLPFEPTPGDDINEGVQMINDGLYYDPERPIDVTNRPRLYVCEDCWNIAFALANWTGADGTKGACKDPVDIVRYFMLSGAMDMGGTGDKPASRGGYY